MRLWLREGTVAFRAAERWLREDVAAARPRLALARCLALVLAGRLREARRRYRTLSGPSGIVRAGAADASDASEKTDAALELAAEHCVVRGTIALHGGERLDSEWVREELAERERLAPSGRLDALTRGYLEHGLGIAAGMRARFATAREHTARARELFAGSAYMTMLVDVVDGQAAMARGLPEEAAAHYHRARKTARKAYVLDPVAPAMCEALLRELALECNGGAAVSAVSGALEPGGTPFQPYAAACAGAVELQLDASGAEAALAAANELLAPVRAARLPALLRYLAALRVSVLAAAGRPGDAERAWDGDGLPAGARQCLDLEGQSWREMEALCSARLRLAIARGGFAAARRFARQFRAAARKRELRRTLMRAEALSVALERRAGDAAAAVRRLQAYLRLYAETPYAGPLVRERADCAPVLAAYLESAGEGAGTDAARALRAAMETAARPKTPVLSERERAVLRRLGAGKDKQIAEELGLSRHGVRYHLRNLFRKLGARNRREAVRRAREMGLVPGEF